MYRTHFKRQALHIVTDKSGSKHIIGIEYKLGLLKWTTYGFLKPERYYITVSVKDFAKREFVSILPFIEAAIQKTVFRIYLPKQEKYTVKDVDKAIRKSIRQIYSRK